MLELYVALMHYPVLNRKGDVIASAVTNLDLHDIARAAKTYGVRAFYVVTPLDDQQQLIKRLLAHWITGAGAEYNRTRRNALDLVRTAESLETVTAEIESECGRYPETVVTTAKKTVQTIAFASLLDRMEDDGAYLLLFGTAWGFSDEFISEADHVLEPIMADSEYNHLSVRSAVAIVLDRLKGDYRGNYADVNSD